MERGVRFEIGPSCDSDEWDGFVSSRASGHFMQSYAWGDFQRQMGWETRYSVIREGSGIQAAALIVARRLPGFGGKVFYAPRGPVVNPDDLPAMRSLIQGIAEYVRSEGGAFLRFDPYWTESAVSDQGFGIAHLRPVARDWSSWNGPKFVFWLDLSRSEETLLSGMTSGCRNEIRRGHRNGVTFALGGQEDLREFHRLMSLTAEQKGIAVHSLEYYRTLHATLNRSARAQLFLGQLDGEVVTAGISVAYGAKSWLLYAASSPAHYKLRANRAQQWEMIRWAHGLGCYRYDFRGTATNDPPRPTDPGYGVYEFKKSFGPTFVRLAGYYDLVARPVVYHALRFAEDHLLPTAYRGMLWYRSRRTAGRERMGAE